MKKKMKDTSTSLFYVIDTEGPLQIIINHSTGRWMAVGNDLVDFILSLDENFSMDSLAEEFKGIIQEKDIRRVLTILTEEGLLADPIQNHTCKTSKVPGLAVLKVTTQCNLNCRYCYENSGIHKNDYMSFETAIKIIDDMIQLNQSRHVKPTIVFHGGEPLLHWACIKKVVLHYNDFTETPAKFVIQTNATLLTMAMVEFIKKYEIDVGVSIDGTMAMNDQLRMRADGSGSYEAIVAGIQRLNEKKVSFGAITVITQLNIDKIGLIFDHLISLNIRSLSFIPLFYGGRGQAESESLAVDGGQLFVAYKEITKRIIEFNKNLPVGSRKVEERMLKYLTDNIMTDEPKFMCMRTPCGAGSDTLSFNPNGDTYVCDDFSGIDDFCIGNIHENNLRALLDCELIHHLSSKTLDGIVNCRSCEFRNLCYGLCPGQSYHLNKMHVDINPECEFRKLMIPFFLELFTYDLGIHALFDANKIYRQPRIIVVNIDEPSDIDLSDLIGVEFEVIDAFNVDDYGVIQLMKLYSVTRADKIVINSNGMTSTPKIRKIVEAILDRRGKCAVIIAGVVREGFTKHLLYN